MSSKEVAADIRSVGADFESCATRALALNLDTGKVTVTLKLQIFFEIMVVH
jgi:hypothetical protein